MTTNTGDETHPWVARLSMEICSDCGTVRRHDRMNSACRGKVKVALRGERSGQ
jgi:hypothetical protein